MAQTAAKSAESAVDYLSIKEAASIARVDTDDIRRWHRRGLFPGVKLQGTRTLLIPRAQFVAWVSSGGGR